MLHVLWRIHIDESGLVLSSFFATGIQLGETWTASLLLEKVSTVLKLVSIDVLLTNARQSRQPEYLYVLRSTMPTNRPTTQPGKQGCLLEVEHIREGVRIQRDERREILVEL